MLLTKPEYIFRIGHAVHHNAMGGSGQTPMA
jgi:hypothetical protein